MTTDTTGLRQSRVLLKQASLRRSSADTWVARHTLRDSQVLPRSGGSSCDFKVYFNFPKTQCWLLSVTSACLHVRVFCFRNFSLTPEFLHLKCTGNHQSWLTLRPQGLWPAGLLSPWNCPPCIHTQTEQILWNKSSSKIKTDSCLLPQVQKHFHYLNLLLPTSGASLLNCSTW